MRQGENIREEEMEKWKSGCLKVIGIRSGTHDTQYNYIYKQYHLQENGPHFLDKVGSNI